jgi:hypothetical protein
MCADAQNRLSFDATGTPSAMTLTPIQPLDYAPASLRRRSDPAVSPPLGALVPLVAVAAVLCASSGKPIPGGPFVSVRADLTPFVTCVGVIAFAWRSLRHGTLRRRLCVALVVLFAAAVAILAVDHVVSFWFRPYARGALVGW